MDYQDAREGVADWSWTTADRLVAAGGRLEEGPGGRAWDIRAVALALERERMLARVEQERWQDERLELLAEVAGARDTAEDALMRALQAEATAAKEAADDEKRLARLELAAAALQGLCGSNRAEAVVPFPGREAVRLADEAMGAMWERSHPVTVPEKPEPPPNLEVRDGSAKASLSYLPPRRTLG